MSIGPWEIVVLAILAVVLFGPEKLPELARKAARVLAYLRGIANDATGQLRRELGPDYANLELSDLNPRSFVRKHLLSDVEPIVADVKKDLDEASKLGNTETAGVREELNALEADGDADADVTKKAADRDPGAGAKADASQKAALHGDGAASGEPELNGDTTPSADADDDAAKSDAGATDEPERPETIGEALFSPAPRSSVVTTNAGVSVMEVEESVRSDVAPPPWDREAT